MAAQRLTRAAVLALLVGGVACARNNKTDDEVGAAQDSTMTAKTDSTSNQTESGVTDSTGKSTLGKNVEQSRPDQGQPVTAKGDTLNQGVDSAQSGTHDQARTASDSSSASVRQDSTANSSPDSAANQTESGITDSTGQSTLGKGVEQTRPDQSQPVTAKGDTLNQGVDSATPQR